MHPNRMGLGLRPPMPSFGQGPSMQALAQQQQAMQFMPPQAQKPTRLFVGSISGGVQDEFINDLLSVRIASLMVGVFFDNVSCVHRPVEKSTLLNDSSLLRVNPKGSVSLISKTLMELYVRLIS